MIYGGQRNLYSSRHYLIADMTLKSDVVDFVPFVISIRIRSRVYISTKKVNPCKLVNKQIVIGRLAKRFYHASIRLMCTFACTTIKKSKRCILRYYMDSAHHFPSRLYCSKDISRPGVFHIVASCTDWCLLNTTVEYYGLGTSSLATVISFQLSK
jgi:hypothetical protein